jgi:hypothetical protein
MPYLFTMICIRGYERTKNTNLFTKTREDTVFFLLTKKGLHLKNWGILCLSHFSGRD